MYSPVNVFRLHEFCEFVFYIFIFRPCCKKTQTLNIIAAVLPITELSRVIPLRFGRKPISIRTDVVPVWVLRRRFSDLTRARVNSRSKNRRLAGTCLNAENHAVPRCYPGRGNRGVILTGRENRRRRTGSRPFSEEGILLYAVRSIGTANE